MQQLQTTVQQNAATAQRASELARNRSSVAERGGAVVQQMVQVVQGIQESSRRIADIIGVIDGVALQTNILALNAVVEAARAGEQGRGVAVVASKVRNLATCSASAAQEIKTFSQASSHQTNDMQRVTQSIVRMDEATQQNTALLEDSAAAAGSLISQARDLVQAVAVFRLRHQGSNA